MNYHCDFTLDLSQEAEKSTIVILNRSLKTAHKMIL